MRLLDRALKCRSILRKKCVLFLEEIKERNKDRKLIGETSESIFRRLLSCKNNKNWYCQMTNICPVCNTNWKLDGSYKLGEYLKNAHRASVWCRTQKIMWPRTVGYIDGVRCLGIEENACSEKFQWAGGVSFAAGSDRLRFEDIEDMLSLHHIVDEMIDTRTALCKVLYKHGVLGTMSKLYVGPLSELSSGAVLSTLVVIEDDSQLPKKSVYWSSCDHLLTEYWDMSDEGITSNWYIDQANGGYSPELKPPLCGILYPELGLPLPHKSFEESIGKKYTQDRRNGFCIPLTHSFNIRKLRSTNPHKLVDNAFYDYFRPIGNSFLDEILCYQSEVRGKRTTAKTGIFS